MLKRFKQKIMSIGLSVMMVASHMLGIISPNLAQAVEDDPYFVDDQMAKVVRTALNMPSGPITDWSPLKYLIADGISTSGSGLDVSDLSKANKLKVLSIKKNLLQEGTLVELPRGSDDIREEDRAIVGLEALYMSELLNESIDVSKISHLKYLKVLDLQKNRISNFNALGNLPSLDTLLLEGARFTNVGNYPNLNKLTNLKLGDNALSDLTAIVTKTPLLQDLFLGTNNISDISALTLNNLPLRTVDLGLNPLNDNAAQVINTLKNRGVSVSSRFYVTAPNNYMTTSANSVVIRGLGKAGSVVYINGNQSVAVGTNGEFTYTYKLQPGLNEISVTTSEDSTLQFKRYVVYDDTLVLTSPAENLKTNDKVRIIGRSKIINSRLDILLNGRKVSDVIADINGNFSKEISLLNIGTPNSYNSISVVANVGGNAITLSRNVYYDRISPALNATVDRTITNLNYTMVTGSATDISSPVTVTINGTGVTFKTGTNAFEKKVTLRNGANSIRVKATDAAGNVTEKVLAVTYDNVAPKLFITSPETFEVQSHGLTYLVSGTTEEGTTVKVNGVVIPNEKGKFSKEFELVNGNNDLIITATDAAGNITTSPLRKVYSFAPTITGPANLYRTKYPTVAVTGKGSPGTILKINNVDYKVPADGNIYKAVRLEPGIFTNITIEYNGSKITRRVAYDNSVYCSLGNPVNNLATNKNSVTVSGKTENDGSVNIKVNNVDLGYALIDANGDYSREVPLTLGENIIQLTFTDYVGNTATFQRKVIYDTTPPELTIYSPTDKVQLKVPRLMGKTEAGSVVKVNNETFNIGQDGYIDVPLKLSLGDITLNITSTDRAGNVTTVTKQVSVVNNISLNLLEPNQEYTNNSTLTIKGSAPAQSSVKVNNVPVNLDSNNNFSTEVTLREGKNPIVLTALDSTGKLSEVAKTITLDTQKPIVNNIVAEPYASSYSTKGQFKLTFVTDLNANNSPIQAYDLQWRYSEKGDWQDFKSDFNQSSIIFASSKLGVNYYFRVRAKDKAGNLGEWTNKSYRVIVPYDDNALVISKAGFTKRTVNQKSAHYKGTLTSSLKAGEQITYKFTGNHLALIGAKGVYGAKAKIFIDGKYLGIIDTYSGTSKARQVLFNRSWPSTGTHTIKILNAGNKSRYRIDLDAIAIGRE